MLVVVMIFGSELISVFIIEEVWIGLDEWVFFDINFIDLVRFYVDWNWIRYFKE